MTAKRARAWRRRALIALGGVVLALGIWVWANHGSSDRPSQCFGTTSSGALHDAWQLPRTGPNFRAYSDLGWLAGRTFVHSNVHAIVLDAYQRLSTTEPQHKFVYGETGFAAGGSFRPHRTHQNGLSVDFMVPVRDASGKIQELPTLATKKFGYGLEFDDAGKLPDLRIDFEAIAMHLAELKRSATRRHLRIARVIFDPKLRARLADTQRWSEIRDLPFMIKPAWIRHDEHYHVDFEIPCQPFAAER